MPLQNELHLLTQTMQLKKLKKLNDDDEEISIFVRWIKKKIFIYGERGGLSLNWCGEAVSTLFPGMGWSMFSYPCPWPASSESFMLQENDSKRQDFVRGKGSEQLCYWGNHMSYSISDALRSRPNASTKVRTL